MQNTDEISACKPATNIPDGFDTHRDVRYTCTHGRGESHHMYQERLRTGGLAQTARFCMCKYRK